MKFLVFLGLLSTCSALTEEWHLFKRSWRKTYGTPNEEMYRQQVFEDNLSRIKEHNKKFEMGLVSYQMEMNDFGDMTDEEFRISMLPTNMSTTMDGTPVYTFTPPTDIRDVPSSIDWRKEGAVTPVKNTGICGSSYAFSAVGALEGQYFRKYGRLLQFSEQQIVDCSSHFANFGCKGGMPYKAYYYIIKKGIALEDTYPYTGEDNACSTDLCVAAANITGFAEVPNNEDALKAAVASVGPISVTVDATAQFRFYKTGIFDDETCSPYMANLAVLVVGYGTENGKDYWLVKNSWGERWGEKGYIKMSRNKDNQCAVSSSAVYPLM